MHRCPPRTGRCLLPEPVRVVDLPEFIATSLEGLRRTMKSVPRYLRNRPARKVRMVWCARQDPGLYEGAEHPSRMSCPDLPRLSSIHYDFPLSPPGSGRPDRGTVTIPSNDCLGQDRYLIPEGRGRQFMTLGTPPTSTRPQSSSRHSPLLPAAPPASQQGCGAALQKPAYRLPCSPPPAPAAQSGPPRAWPAAQRHASAGGGRSRSAWQSRPAGTVPTPSSTNASPYAMASS